MRLILSAMTCLGLAACGPSGISFEQELVTRDTNLSAEDIVGRSLGGPATAVRFNASERLDATMQFNSPTSVTMTIDGDVSPLLGGTNGIYEVPGTGQQATLGTRLVGGPVTPDVAYLFMADTPPPFLGGQRLIVSVDGNRAPQAALPRGTATFRGAATGITNSGGARSAVGTSVVAYDFAAQAVDVTLTGTNPFDAASQYVFADVDLATSGAFAGVNTSGTLGAVKGAIYGAGADQAAGMYNVLDDGTVVIGVFGAVR